MPSPEIWGPPIWTFIHTIVEKVKEEHYSTLSFRLFSFLRRICSLLPCPECSQHAIRFLNQIKSEQYKTKSDLKTVFFMFHNQVNLRKKKPIFKYGHLDKYRNINLLASYNQFIRVYHTRGNMKFLTESFQRTLLVKDFKQWIIQNIHCFER
jgi:hypothetical protein